MANSNFTYHLATAAEVNRLPGHRFSKMQCPSCGQWTYKPYVDVAGTPVGEGCGKCDRVNNCCYHLTPSDFLRNDPEAQAKREAARNMPKPEPKKRLVLPVDLIKQKRAGNKDNTLLNFLRSRSWNQEQKAMLEVMITLYGIGTDREGRTIWWQCSAEMELRTGKCMKYLPDGHRDKSNFGTWVHSQLFKAGYYDPEKVEKVCCMFGEHMIGTAPMVCIVESEKSALIAATYFGIRNGWEKRVWMATAGKGNLSEHMLLPLTLAKKTIWLFPDHDGYEEWQRKAKEFHYDDIHVSRYVEDNYIEGLDPPGADIADIILRKLDPPNETECQKAHRLLHLTETHEGITALFDKIPDLKIIDYQT